MRWIPRVIVVMIGLFVSTSGAAQTPEGATAPAFYMLWETGTVPRQPFGEELLGIPAVQEELEFSEAQKKAIQEASIRQAERIQKARREIRTNKASSPSTRSFSRTPKRRSLGSCTQATRSP